MTLFEIFIATVFTATAAAIGFLMWRALATQTEMLKTINEEHIKTKDQHSQMLTNHEFEIRKHGLELVHSKETAIRTEREFKTLLQQNNDKFDQIIQLFAQSLSQQK